MDEEFRPHRLDWLLTALREQPSYLEKPMFGCLAVYLRGILVLVLASKGREPWNGILVPTSRHWHESLLREYPALEPHPELGKWLYQSENSEDFEDVATSIIGAILAADKRIGVSPEDK